MFCPHCGTKLPADSRFCSECGAAIANAGTNPQPGKPAGKSLFSGILKFCVLISFLSLAGMFVSQLGLKPMEELVTKGDWYYASVELHDRDNTIRKGNTEYKQDVNRIWENIREEKVREIDEDIYDRISSSEHVSLFFMEEDGDGSIYLAVNSEGDMYVNENHGDTRYFEDAQSIYFAVKSYLPAGDDTSLEYCLPNGNCSSLSISFYDQDMNHYDSVYIYDPVVIRESLDRLQNITLKYGGGIDYSYKGYMAMVGITEEDGDYYFLQIYDNGTADIPQRNWTYGFRDAGDLYHALWDELRVLKSD